MSKQQMIDAIREHNRSAAQEFLARFDEAALSDYLQRLTRVCNHRGKTSRWVRNTTAPAVATLAMSAA
mgnify:CR=1 FL=1